MLTVGDRFPAFHLKAVSGNDPASAFRDVDQTCGCGDTCTCDGSTTPGCGAGK